MFQRLLAQSPSRSPLPPSQNLIASSCYSSGLLLKVAKSLSSPGLPPPALDRDLIRPFPKPDPARESRIGHERPFPAIRLWYAHSRLRTSLGTLRSVQHDSRINPHRQMVPVSAPDGNGSLSPICPKAVVRLPGHTANMSTIRHVRKSTSSTLV